MRQIILIAFSLLMFGCSEQPESSRDSTPDPSEMAQSMIIVDTHIDVPYRLESSPADVTGSAPDGQFDYPRAKTGGLNAAFMSIYTPASYMTEPGKSFAFAEKSIDLVESIAASAPEKFAIADSVDDVRRHFDDGLISLPLGMENGSPIEGDLDNLQHFYARGIRYITLCHSLSNRIADSSYDKENRPWDGLSPFGEETVERMNSLGIMVDVSHISDAAFYDVIRVSRAPVIASHSSARHFTPGFERNMDDAMIRELAKHDGVIMINFGSGFLIPEARAYSDAYSAAYKVYLEQEALESSAEVRETFKTAYVAENGSYPIASVDDVLDHIDHVVNLVGVEYVGIGSDYDGVGDTLPNGLKDVSDFPNLVEGLQGRGYTADDIRLILGENLLRVWSAVESIAAQEST